jgi:hypothetical protein
MGRLVMGKIYGTLTILLITCLFTINTYAQTRQEPILIYEKNSLSGLEYVLLSSHKHTFVLPESACFDISRNGMYIAYLSIDGTTLTISRIDNTSVVLQTLWQANWEYCNFLWVNDSVIAIFSQSSQSYSYFNVINNSLSSVTSPSISNSPVVLPDRLPTDNVSVYIPSPTENYFLYETCSEVQCGGIGNFAIYDTVAQEDIVVLADAAISSPNYAPPGRVNNSPEARWSFDGRYLAYRYLPENIYHNFDLQLYDTTIRSIHQIEAPNWRIDYQHSMSWSPVDYRLVFWVIGRVPEPIQGDTTEIRTAVIYDALEQRLIPLDQPYYVNSEISWKPDGTAFVFLDSNGNLIYVDAVTGITQIIDSDVTRILVWRFPDDTH